MVNPEVPRETTYVLKWYPANRTCNSTKREVRKHLQKIHGVNSIGEIDIANGQGKVTINISITVDPNRVKKEFQIKDTKRKRTVELSEESTPPCPLDHQKMQLALLKPKPPLPQQHIVPQQPYEVLLQQEREVERKNKQRSINAERIKAKTNTSQLGFSITALDESTIWKKNNDRDHPELKLRTCIKPFKCDGCKEDGFGPRYRCEEKNCAFELHLECMNPNRTKAIRPFHGSRKITFEFCRNPPSEKRCCDACGKYIGGCSYIYRDRDRDRDDVQQNLDLDLHPACSNFEAQIQVQGTVFELGEKNKLKKCLLCNKKKSPAEEQSGIRGWSYVSKCKNYKFHLCCLPEMLHEAWKEGVFASAVDGADEFISKALVEAIDFGKMQAKSKNDGDGRGRKVWKIVTMVLKTILGILLGDPTVLIASTLIELIKS